MGGSGCTGSYICSGPGLYPRPARRFWGATGIGVRRGPAGCSQNWDVWTGPGAMAGLGLVSALVSLGALPRAAGALDDDVCAAVD